MGCKNGEVVFEARGVLSGKSCIACISMYIYVNISL